MRFMGVSSFGKVSYGSFYGSRPDFDDSIFRPCICAHKFCYSRHLSCFYWIGRVDLFIVYGALMMWLILENGNFFLALLFSKSDNSISGL